MSANDSGGATEGGPAQGGDQPMVGTDPGLQSNPLANDPAKLRTGDHPGGGSGRSDPQQAGYDPGAMVDGSTEGSAPAVGAETPDGETVDPTGGSSDGGESGQDAGLGS